MQHTQKALNNRLRLWIKLKNGDVAFVNGNDIFIATTTSPFNVIQLGKYLFKFSSNHRNIQLIQSVNIVLVFYCYIRKVFICRIE